MRLPQPAILVITDRRQCRRPLEFQAEALFRGGCRWLSLREKDLDPADRLSLLRRLVALGASHGARVGVHDDIAAAQACHAPLHLPEAADAEHARRVLGDEALLGQSRHDAVDVGGAAGLDYVTLSPVFESASKPFYRPRLTLDGCAAIVLQSPLPVVALGGIGLDTLANLDGIGFQGIAVMGAAMRADDAEAWFRTLAAAWDELGRPGG